MKYKPRCYIEDTFESNICKVCCACYYHLRDLQHFHKFLTFDFAILLANAIVTSRLDYCNYVQFGVSKGSCCKA